MNNPVLPSLLTQTSFPLHSFTLTKTPHVVSYIFNYPPPMAQQPLVSQGLFIIEASRSHLDTPHSIGLPCTSDQPDAETST